MSCFCKVGATFQIAPEKGVFFSQGGFSVYFPRPSWQDEAVPPFLKKLGNTYKGLFKFARTKLFSKNFF